jgi:hypothetical protein
MSNYLLRWYSNGDNAEETFTDQAAVLARISELAVSGKQCELYEQVPIKLRVTASLPRRYRNGSPAAQPTNGRPPAVPAAEPAGDVSKDSQEDPEPRDQVVGVEGSARREGPAHAPEQDREAGAQRLAGSAVPGEGATASPAAANLRWGRIGTPELGAWHLWASADDAEAACSETIGPEVAVVFLDHGMKMEPDQICTECDEIDGQTAPAPVEQRCEHENEAAGVPCNAKATAGKVNGKWSCKRHSRRTSDAQEVAHG